MNPTPPSIPPDDLADAALSRLLRSRPEPAAPADLAARAMRRVVAEREAAARRAGEVEALLIRRRRFNRSVAWAAGLGLAAVIALGAGPVGEQWSLLRQAAQENAKALAAESSASEAAGESGTGSSITSATGSSSASTSSSSETDSMLMIVGGLLVVGLAAAGVQRAMSLNSPGSLQLNMPSLG